MMTKILLNLGVVCAVLCFGTEAAAQSDIGLSTRSAKLQELSEKLYKRDENSHRRTKEFTRRVGIPLKRNLPGGGVLELQRFGPGARPIFYITNNLDAADSVSTDEVRPGGSAGLNLDGGGMTVGEWDGGAIYADHWDFIGRVTQVDGATEVSGHSTHVAGTLMGSGAGLDPRSRGMAYAANLEAYDWNFDTAEMSLAASNGLLMSNHSYGIAAGWLYLAEPPPNTWWWIGGTGDEDPNFGYYDSETQLWDQIAYDAPYYLIVKASGNDRTDIGPSPGEEYTIVDQEGTPLGTAIKGTERPADCFPAGYDCLPTNSVAKNALVVGAVDDVPGGYSSFSGPSQVLMASFSSWGPTDDGRIKPDLVGNGMFLISAWPDSPYYAAAAGTSMAAPNVTGSLLLLQEHYQDLYGTGNFMRAATVKALAIHTADEAGDADGPDYAFGWGLLNTKAAAKVITDNGGAHQIIEGSLADGATVTVNVSVAEADSIITATLVWADPPGTPPAPSLDPPDIMLVNDLDLRIKKNPATYEPWVLNPAIPAAAATTGDNFRDNVEQVEAVGVGTGTYTVEVSHKGTLLNAENQDYSLIISIGTAPPTGSGLLIDENFSGGLPAGWSVNTVMGIPWTINTPVSGDSRLDNGTGGSGNFAFVDNNWGNQTVTSLQTNYVDLSNATAVVLRFNSYYSYDTFESLNVDVSANGGSSWNNVWFFQGFNPLPTLYTLDISGSTAGHSNVMIRFRFDSEGWISGNFWQIDNVQLDVFGIEPPAGDPPGQANNPNPTDGASGVGINTSLSWTAGTDTTSHDVYFGTDSTPDASELQGNQGGTSFSPALAYDTTYYWRIDEVNGDGTTPGDTWSFTTESEPLVPPGLASNPNPAHGATGVNIGTSLSWTAGSDTLTHNVHFGTDSTPDSSEFQGNQGGTSFDPGALAYSTTYYWRIDEVNTDGTTAGATWSFTTGTAPAAPPAPPTGFSATGMSENEINLGWNDVATETEYRVERSPSGAGTFTTIATPPANATSYSDSGLAASTTYDYRVYAVNGGGDSTGFAADSGTTDDPPPPPAFQNYGASSQTLVAGTVTGDFINTHDLDGVSQSIGERESGGRKSSRYSYLEHRWNFTIAAGDTVTVNLTARSGGSTDGDIFRFEYSLNGGGYQSLPLLDIPSTSYTTMSDTLPAGSSGSVVIRVVDSNRVSGNRALDTVYVDDLYIQVGSPSSDPPIGDPSGLSASMASSSQINLGWTDGTDNESGFKVEHTLTDPDGPTTPVWTERADLPAGSTSYSDIGLNDETTYFYRVHAYNSNGVSAYTNFANATTDAAPALGLTASGYKDKGKHHVELIWTGSTNVDIYRGTTMIASGFGGSVYDDNIGAKGGATYTHRVCQAGTDSCSNVTTTVF